MKMTDDKAVQYGKKMFWWGIMLFILLALYQCANEAITKKAEDLKTKRSVPQGYMENGYWIPEEILPTPIPKVTSETYRREMAEGTVIEIVTNCQNNELITTLEPGGVVEIRHVDHGPYDMGSRCSYGFDGKIAPVNGHPERVARPRFEGDLFFPPDAIPAEAMGFYMVDEYGKGLARDYIKKIGGKIYLYHPSHATGRATVYMQINLPQGEVAKKRGQIGWDGSTLHIFATKFN